MQQQEARRLVTMLVAAFRPRDWGRTNEAVYVECLLDLDAVQAENAVRWIMQHDTFFPTIARLRDEIVDDYHAPPIETLDRTSLPGYRPPALPGEVPAAIVQPLTEVLHHAMSHREPDAHIDYDPEQVKRRKAEAAEAAAKERARLNGDAK